MLNKFKRLISAVGKVGFDSFHQAGSPSQYHELNIVAESKVLDRRYWVSKSFGKFHVSYRDDLTHSKNRAVRTYCKNQTEVINILNEIAEEINQAKLQIV